MTGLLAGRHIVITGASGGIGRAIALACAREGAQLALHAHRHADAAQETAAAIAAMQGVVPAVLQFDLADAAALEAQCAPLIAQWGRLDGWVNNAGMNQPGLLLTQDDAMIAAQLDVNLAATLRACRYAVGHMLASGGGAIVNIGSIAATRPARGQAVYAAAKGGQAALTRALAVEYGRKQVRVNCIEPGPIDTAMLAATRRLAEDEVRARVPLGRLGTPEDVAELAVFLLSARAGFITGGVFAVDGGYSLAGAGL